MASLALPLAGTLLSTLGGIFGNRPKTITSNSTSTLTNQFSPEAMGLRDQLLRMLTQQAQAPTDLQGTDFSGLRATALNNINAASRARMTALNTALARRGLNNSPGAISTALVGNEGLRTGQQADALNNIDFQAAQEQAQLPLLRQNLINQRLGNVMSGLSPFINRTQTTSGSQTLPGNMLGGALSSGSDALFSALGFGLFGKKKPGFSFGTPGPNDMADY